MIVMGLETEYGQAFFGAMGRSPGDVVRVILERAAARFPHLPDRGGGMFMGSGGRVMVDTGSHLEYSTPEMLTPAGLVVAARAGEAILRELVHDLPGVVISRTNQCYLTGATYGSHENYSVRGPLDRLNRLLLAHYVSRYVYIGAGGLDPDHPGIRLVLSPRALHHVRPPGAEFRAIVSTRDEAHATNGMRRMHVTCGDTLVLDRPLYLRFGTTALLLALLDAGRLDASSLPVVSDARRALEAIVTDHRLRATVDLADGTTATALDIQRRLRSLAGAAVERSPSQAPPWAAGVMRKWGRTLDTLDLAPGDAVIDWVVKHRLMEDQIARAGFSTDAVARLDERLHRERPARPVARSRVAALAERMGIIDEVARRGRRRSSVPGPDDGPATEPAGGAEPVAHDEEVERFLALRERLSRLDFFFGAIPDGLVDPIGGALDDRVEGVTGEAVRRATRVPPEATRAVVRARFIRRLNRMRERYVANWSVIHDLQQRRHLQLGDPFAVRAAWACAKPSPPSLDDRHPLPLLSRAYNCGDFRSLRRELARVFGTDDPARRSAWRTLLPYAMWLESRTGHVAAAERAMHEYRTGRVTHELPGMWASIYRFQGLVPSPRIWRWIRRADAMPRTAWSDSGYVSYLGHKGVALRCAGRIDEAIDVLRASVRVELSAPNHQRIAARNQCDLADCYRIRGEDHHAHANLAAARRIFDRHGYIGEQAEHHELTRARLDATGTGARRRLERARAVLTRLGNPVAAVRAGLLLARISGSPRVARSVRRSVLRTMAHAPDLRACPRVRRVLGHWHRWVDPHDTTDGRDPFWFV